MRSKTWIDNKFIRQFWEKLTLPFFQQIRSKELRINDRTIEKRKKKEKDETRYPKYVGSPQKYPGRYLRHRARVNFRKSMTKFRPSHTTWGPVAGGNLHAGETSKDTRIRLKTHQSARAMKKTQAKWNHNNKSDERIVTYCWKISQAHRGLIVL